MRRFLHTGNIHKWLFAPRGCALLWVHPKHHDVTRPILVSHNHMLDTLEKRFVPSATRDSTAYLAVPSAIAFHKALGGLVSRPFMEYLWLSEKKVSWLILKIVTTETMLLEWHNSVLWTQLSTLISVLQENIYKEIQNLAFTSLSATDSKLMKEVNCKSSVSSNLV